jgi:ABC-type lipoprotein export system ATPase subunit
MRLFRELNDAGLTIIMVTHEPDVAARSSTSAPCKVN